ncbi:MAG: hypothetical protein ACFFAE_15750 [Candidatus Hodarchaeota archaeon]
MQKDIRYLQERSVNINRITDRLVVTFNKFADEYLKTEGKFDPIYYYREGKLVQYVTVEEDGYAEESVVLALDSAGLWILEAEPYDLKEVLPIKSNQKKFSELPSKVQFQLISDLPEIVKFFADEMLKKEEQAQEILEKLEKIVEDFNSEDIQKNH